DTEAQRIAREAYAPWRDAIGFLWERSKVDFVLAGIYPKTFEELQAIGHGIAGTPSTVRDYLKDLQRETGINYLRGQMVFGTMTFAESARSLQLFAREVMPAFKRQFAGTRVSTLAAAARLSPTFGKRRPELSGRGGINA